MVDVMIDFETLGTRKDTALLSIGAVSFKPESKNILSKFSRNIDPDSCIQAGMTVSGATIQWWFGQSEQARSSLKIPLPVSIQDVMKDFTSWVAPIIGRDGCVWSHGSIFDIAIIEDVYQRFDQKIPWFFTRIMDTRTLFRIADFDFTAWNKSRGGVAHNSLDDAIAQVEAVSIAWNRIKNPRLPIV